MTFRGLRVRSPCVSTRALLPKLRWEARFVPGFGQSKCQFWRHRTRVELSLQLQRHKLVCSERIGHDPSDDVNERPGGL